MVGFPNCTLCEPLDLRYREPTPRQNGGLVNRPEIVNPTYFLGPKRHIFDCPMTIVGTYLTRTSKEAWARTVFVQILYDGRKKRMACFMLLTIDLRKNQP